MTGGFVLRMMSDREVFVGFGVKLCDFGCGSGPSVDLDLENQLGCDQELSGCEGGGCASAGTLQIPFARLLGVIFIFVGAMLRRRT